MQTSLDQINLKFFRKTALIVFFYVIIYSLTYWALDARFSSVFLLIVSFIFTPLILLLDGKGFRKTSRYLFLVSCALYILAPILGIRADLHIEYYFLVSLVLPYFLFDPFEKISLAFGVMVSALGWAYSKWGVMPDLPLSWMPVSMPVELFQVLSFVGSFLILLFFIKFFVERYHAKNYELSNFFNISIDILGIAGPDGRFKKLNPAFTQLLGYSIEEFTSRPFIDYVHPDDVGATLSVFGKAAEGGPVLKFENRYRCKDGTYKIISWVGATDPKTRDSYCAGRDVTEKRQGEMELRQVYEAIDRSGAVTITDRTGKILSANTNFCNLSGYTLQELIGQNHDILRAESHPEGMIEKLWQTILAGKVWSGEFHEKTKDGRDYYVQAWIAPLTDVNGVVERFLSIQFDVTKQKDSERLLAEAQSVARIGSFAFDVRTHDLKWSRQLYEFFPVDPSLGPPDFEHHKTTIHPEDYYIWSSTIEESIKTGKSYKMRFRSIFPDGKFLWIEALGKAGFDSEGNVITLSGTCQDVTDIVTAEEILKFERVKAIQNAKLASLGEMAAGIAHEINNPLAIITLAISKLDRHVGDPEKLKTNVEIVERATERIKKIVSGLRKFSRSAEKSEYRIFLLANILREAIVLTEIKAKRHGISVIVDEKYDGEILCDEIEIEQVLINLINNGIDAAAGMEEKWVKVELSVSPEHVILRVSDSGKGIQPGVKNKLFQPFFTTKAVGEGTGLGLSIVKGILDGHKASIELVSNSAHTCFEIKFPKLMKHHAT